MAIEGAINKNDLPEGPVLVEAKGNGINPVAGYYDNRRIYPGDRFNLHNARQEFSNKWMKLVKASDKVSEVVEEEPATLVPGQVRNAKTEPIPGEIPAAKGKGRKVSGNQHLI